MPFTLLRAIADEPEEELRRGLAHLQAAEFLYETRLFPESEYTFKHALTHQVAYENLLHGRRRALHARIMEAIETLYPDRLTEQVERLAHHAMRGEVWDKALSYCRHAGVKAVARSAHREAVSYFEQALLALKHLPPGRDVHEQAIDLRLDLRSALFPLGELGQILDYLREAEALAEALNDQWRLARVSSYISHYFWLTGKQDLAIESGQRSRAFAESLGDFALQVSANLHLGTAYYALGHYDRAMDVCRRTVTSLEEELLHERFGLAGIPSVTFRAAWVWCLSERGEFAEGTAQAGEAVRLAEAVDHPYSRSVASFSVGFLYLRKGDFQKAISVLERGLELCQVANIPIWLPRIASVLGAAYALSGRISAALPLLEQAVEKTVRMGIMSIHALLVAWLSEAHLLADCMDKAAELAGHALQLAQDHKERGHQAWALRLLGEIAAHRDPPEVERAEDYYRQALALAHELGMRPLQAHCHHGLGSLYGKIGQGEQARTELSAAIELYRTMEMTFWLPQAEAALAQVV